MLGVTVQVNIRLLLLLLLLAVLLLSKVQGISTIMIHGPGLASLPPAAGYNP